MDVFDKYENGLSAEERAEIERGMEQQWHQEQQEAEEDRRELEVFKGWLKENGMAWF